MSLESSFKNGWTMYAEYDEHLNLFFVRLSGTMHGYKRLKGLIGLMTTVQSTESKRFLEGVDTETEGEIHVTKNNVSDALSCAFALLGAKG